MWILVNYSVQIKYSKLDITIQWNIKILLEECLKTWEDSHNEVWGLKERMVKIVYSHNLKFIQIYLTHTKKGRKECTQMITGILSGGGIQDCSFVYWKVE